MLTRRVAWVIAVPLAVGSWLGAHSLAYLLVSPGAEQDVALHAEHGHAWLGYTPALLVWGLALLVGGLVLCVGEGLRGRLPSPPPARLFAVLPAVGFAVQETLERLLSTGAVPYDLATEPTFVVGLALQLPFALAALLLTRALYTIAFNLGLVIADRLAPGQPRLHGPSLPVSLRAWTTPPGPSALALGHGQRAPPALGPR
jgi:hypothetical protein